nr:uncharacterized protein, chloroplastic [Quercus suber]
MGFQGTDVTEGSERLAEAIGDDSEAMICAIEFKPGWDLFAPWKNKSATVSERIGESPGIGLGGSEIGELVLQFIALLPSESGAEKQE